MRRQSCYGLAPEALVETLVGLGAVGCTIEDSDHPGGGLVAAEVRAHGIGRMRAAADRLGVPLVINARIDVFLPTSGVAASRRGPEAIARARMYRSAGADCVFPVGAGLDDVRALVEAVHGPVNVGRPQGTDPLRELRGIGVARCSMGPRLHGASMDQLRLVLTTLRGTAAVP